MASSSLTSATLLSESQDPSSTPSPSFSLKTSSSSNPSFEIATSTGSSLAIESNSPSSSSTPSFFQSPSTLFSSISSTDSSILASSSWFSNPSSAVVPTSAQFPPLLVSKNLKPFSSASFGTTIDPILERLSYDSSLSLFSNSLASASPPSFSSLTSMSAPPFSASTVASFSVSIGSAFSGSTSSSAAPSTPAISAPTLFSSGLGSCSTIPAPPFLEEKDSKHPKRTAENVLNLQSKERKRRKSLLCLKTPEELQIGKEIATNMVVQGVFRQDRNIARKLSFDSALAEYAFNSRRNEAIIAGAFAEANRLRGDLSAREALIASKNVSLKKYASEKITLEKRIKQFEDIVKLKDIQIKGLENTIGLKDQKIEEFNNVNAEVEKKLVAFETKARQMFDITETYQAAIPKIKEIGPPELILKKDLTDDAKVESAKDISAKTTKIVLENSTETAPVANDSDLPNN